MDTTTNNLYTLARRAVDAGEYAKAEAYYMQILPTNPNDWEAVFYSVFSGAMTLAGRSLSSAIQNLRNGHTPVYNLILSTTDDKSKQYEMLDKVVECLSSFTEIYYDYAKKFFRELGGLENRKIFINQAANMIWMMLDCGDAIESKFAGEEFYFLEAKAWKQGVKLINALCAEMPGAGFEDIKKSRDETVQKIRRIDPNYSVPQKPTASTGGCYVATAVYGSYDCPQVWTLRRYRDYTLAASWCGRAFIRIYYAISPTLVKWFGKTKWFKNICKRKLDKMVMKLNANGVDNTPYNDINWNKKNIGHKKCAAKKRTSHDNE